MCYARAQLNIQLRRNWTTIIHYNVRSWKSHTHTHTHTHIVYYHMCEIWIMNSALKTLVGSRRLLPHTTATRPPDVSERSSSPWNRALGRRFSFIFDKSSANVVVDFLQVTATRTAHNGQVLYNLYSRAPVQYVHTLLFLLLIGFYYRFRYFAWYNIPLLRRRTTIYMAAAGHAYRNNNNKHVAYR